MVSMSYFLTEMYSTRASKVDVISVWTIYHWNLSFIGFPRIQLSSRSMFGFVRNLQKCDSQHTQNSRPAAHCNVVRRYHGNDSVVAGCALVLRSLGYLASLWANVA